MRLPFLASAFLLTGSLCFGQSLAPLVDMPSGPTTAPKRPISFDLTSIDKTADPCTDFYQFSCGNWLKNNPIPSDQVRWGRFNELGERNNYLLYQELKTAAEAPKSPLQKKYGDYFAACMNVDAVDQLGAKPLQPELKVIDSLTDKKQLASLDVELEKRFGRGAFFGVGVTQDQKDSTQQILATGQGGLTLPDRDYYLTKDARSQKLLDQYVAHVTKMFTLLGDTPDQAAKEAASVLAIETALAQGSMARVDMRDPAKRYHIMTVAETQALSPDFNWQQYLAGNNFGQVKTLNISSPG